MSQSITPSTSANPVSAVGRIPALASIAAKLESAMDAVRPFGDAEVPRDIKLALASLLLSCNVALDSLAAIGGRATLADMAAAAGLPPIQGGAPVACDDFEELCEEFQADPAGWPSYPDPEVDGYRWEPNTFEGSTPLSVLEASAPEEHRTFSPSAADWEYLFSAGRDGLITEHDLAAAGLAVG